MKARGYFHRAILRHSVPTQIHFLMGFPCDALRVGFVNSEVHEKGSSTAAPRGKSVLEPVLLQVSSSCEVLHDKEHDEAGQGHAPQHEELVLEGALLDQPHHRVGQPQHVGNVQDLLVSAL